MFKVKYKRYKMSRNVYDNQVPIIQLTYSDLGHRYTTSAIKKSTTVETLVQYTPIPIKYAVILLQKRQMSMYN